VAGEPRVTPFGKLISLLLVLGVVAVGIYMVKGKSGGASSETSKESEEGPAQVSELQLEVPRLAPAAAHQLKDNTVPIEISEYAGYAGLIAANGGLNPSENSVFFRNGGFKVKLTVSEEESWSALNSGALAGSVTTTDVLAVYGRQFQVVVPAQIGFSRGADGLVVRSDINRRSGAKSSPPPSSPKSISSFAIWPRKPASPSRPWPVSTRLRIPPRSTWSIPRTGSAREISFFRTWSPARTGWPAA
jgi:NitT/TauT family transport system substrate-binding protein